MSINVPISENASVATKIPVSTPLPTIVIVDTLMLQNALAKYARVIVKKHARRIVQGIRITAAADHIDLCGTDLEVALRATMPAAGTVTFSNVIVAEYKAMHNAAKAVRDSEVRIAIHGDSLTVSDSGSSAHISSIGDVDDFPEPPRRLTLEECLAAKEAGAPAEQKQNAAKLEELTEFQQKTLPLEFQEFSVFAESLSSAMLYVLPGVAVDQTRYALGGVFMTGNGRGGVEFVSSNTHVLYRHDVALTAGALQDSAGFIILPKAAEWLSKYACGTLTIRTNPNAVFVEGGGFLLTGRCIEGMFPRYHDVLPEQSRMPGGSDRTRPGVSARVRPGGHCREESAGVQGGGCPSQGRSQVSVGPPVRHWDIGGACLIVSAEWRKII